MTASKEQRFDLVVIGTGMAGAAAAVFAAGRGLATAQVGETGELIFASGYLDLLGVHPPENGRILNDPWAGLVQLARDEPDHPLARLAPETIRTALDEFFHFLTTSGLPYYRDTDKNSEVLTPLGTTKPTYGVPGTMWAGVKALRDKQPCLLIDIRGLRGFSARQIAAVWETRWPKLRTHTIGFPGSGHLSELYTETMARQMELPQNLDALSGRIKPHVKDAEVVGLPAVLGIRKCKAVAAALAEKLAVPVFEIPTMPPGVPGLRLRDIFAESIAQLGVYLYREKRVRAVQPEPGGAFALTIADHTGAEMIYARRVLLAGGRFLGKGLLTDQAGIREPLLDLPVHQPRSRQGWHRRYFLDPRGHAVNRAGLETDQHLRPLDEKGVPAFKNLYAAGSILAHQDWMRRKCGSGLAIATAYAAVVAMTTDD